MLIDFLGEEFWRKVYPLPWIVDYANAANDLELLYDEFYGEEKKIIFIFFYFDTSYAYDFKNISRELFNKDYSEYVNISFNGLLEMTLFESFGGGDPKIPYYDNIFISINRYWYNNYLFQENRKLIDISVKKLKSRFLEKTILYVVIPLQKYNITKVDEVIKVDKVEFYPPFNYPFP